MKPIILLMRTLGILLLLSGIVFICYTYYKAVPFINDPKANLQLSRIDFSDTLTANQAKAIRASLAEIEGVQHAFVNPDAGTLVYSHYPAVVSAEKVHAQLSAAVPQPMQRHRVDAAALASGCPVTGEKGIMRRMTNFWLNIFRNPNAL